MFKANPSSVNALVNAGIDVLSIANNHILDFMEPGLMQTQNVLRESGIIFSELALIVKKHTFHLNHSME